MTDQPLLRVDNLSVSFGAGAEAVRLLSYSLCCGETLGVVGESGSGKSASALALLGLLPQSARTTGEAWLGDTQLLNAHAGILRSVRGRRIGIVFQDPMTALNPTMRIGDQIAESLRLHGRTSRAAARRRVLEALEEVGIADGERRMDHYPHEFSGGMCQRVMIAMALIAGPELLVADEPTSALDVQVQAQILALLKDLQQQRNLGIVLISHDLDVVRRAADRVLVMRRGEVMEEGDIEQIMTRPSHPYTRALIDAVPRSAKPEKYRQDMARARTLLEVTGMHVRFGPRNGANGIYAVKDANLTVCTGEVLGVVGESGSGKTTLSRAVVRLLDIDGGRIVLDGKPLHALSAADLRPLRRQIQMVFQDPYSSLNPRMTVQQIIAEPLLLHGLTGSRQAAWGRVAALLEEVGLVSGAAKRYPHQFSGGQRQRIAIARALACEPRILIADEIVSALDVTVQAKMLELLLDLVRERGLSMIFISHDLAVVRYVSDRVAVMKDGVLVETGDTETVMTSPVHVYTRELVGLVHV